MTVLSNTREAPTRKDLFGRKSNARADIKHERRMLNELAKTFNTLSAYLTTTATINPPTACTVITVSTIGEYPTKKPFCEIFAESCTIAVTSAMAMENSPI
mmetsp:Transcript_1643/g.2455  ORF Transcript_1643/g.2455 Transcript_1643/m.2455 type:complete len:101 (-) Transcript_1643:904-1206(-)